MNDSHGGYRITLLGEIAHRAIPTSQGGSGVSLIRLANALTEAGQRVEVLISAGDRITAYADQLHQHVRLLTIGGGRRPFQLFRLARYCVTRRPDLLIVRDTRAIDLGLAVKRFLGNRIRLVCAMHNESVVRAERNRSRERRKQRRFRNMQRYADRVVGVSPGITETAARRAAFAPGQLHTIPNPAYVESSVQFARSAPIARPSYNAHHIVSAGRLSSEKDQATLVRALHLLVADRGLDVHLTLLGEGPEREALATLARELHVEERVHMPGFVRYPLTYMADADAFVLSSLREAFGLVIVEALAIGLPVVSTDCLYGPRFILDDGRYGRLVPVGDPPELSRAIATTLTEPNDPAMLTSRAREFAPDTIAANYIELMNAAYTSG